jgi:hypothetical protein
VAFRAVDFFRALDFRAVDFFRALDFRALAAFFALDLRVAAAFLPAVTRLAVLALLVAAPFLAAADRFADEDFLVDFFTAMAPPSIEWNCRYLSLPFASPPKLIEGTPMVICVARTRCALSTVSNLRA